MKVNLIIGILLIGTTACLKKDYGPKLQTDVVLNSLNFGLIGMNQNNLFLNKVNDITTYDFSGNQIKIINTYNRSKYKSMLVNDSFLVLSDNNMLLYKMEAGGSLKEVTKLNYLYDSYYTNELVLKDTLMLILNHRFASIVQNYYNPPEESRRLNIYDYNVQNNTISTSSKTSHLSLNASSFCILQDSIIFFMNNKINMFNINDTKPATMAFDFLFNPDNALTTSICIGDRLYTSNSQLIYGFAYSNNKLTPKGEVK